MASRFNIPNADVGSGITPADGAQLFFFDTGTSNLRTTFSDEAATTPNPNPVQADQNGVFPDIWLVGQYKVVLQNKKGKQVGFGEADPVIELTNITTSSIFFDTVADLELSSLDVGITAETRGYTAAGDGGENTYLIVTGGTGTADGGSFINIANGNQAKGKFGSTLSLKQFGAPGDGTDQFTELAAAVAFGDANSVSIDITGMNVRVGKQANADVNYNDIDGTPGTYAIKVDTFIDIFSEDRSTSFLGNLNADDDQYVIFAEDANYASFRNITMDGKHTEQGFGGVLFLMGCDLVYLDLTKNIGDGALRVGASPAKPAQKLVYTDLDFDDGWGTFCIGCKPGGCLNVRGGTLTFDNCRGGANWEAEDVNGFGHNAKMNVQTVGYSGIGAAAYPCRRGASNISVIQSKSTTTFNDHTRSACITITVYTVNINTTIADQLHRGIIGVCLCQAFTYFDIVRI